MKIFSFLILLATVAQARPTLEEALDFDPVDPPLAAEFLPDPNLPVGLDFADSEYGWAVAIQGNFAFVSAPVVDDFGNGQPGTVHVFRRLSTGWQEVQILTPPDADAWMRFGQSLDLSEDGSILVVGSNDIQQDSPSTDVASGAYLFTRNPLTLRYEFTQKLVPSSVVPDQWTGNSCAISGDWIALGAPGTDELGPNEGSAYLFQRDPATGTWIERQKFFSDGLAEEQGFGTTVTLDGSNLCINAVRDSISGRDSGRIYVYHLDTTTGTWNREDVFTRPNAPDSYGHNFGYWMDLSGNRLFASFRDSENEEGHTFWYERVGDSWVKHVLRSNYQPSDEHQTQSPYTGRVIAQSGNIAVTGGVNATFGNFNGTATTVGELFRYATGTYTSELILGDVILKTPAPAGLLNPVESFGRPISIATDGTTVLVAMGAKDTGGSTVPLIAAIASSPLGTLPRIRPLLFYGDADPAAPQNAAFAYQTLLYDNTTPGAFSTRHDEIETLYAQINRDNAAAAEELLRFSYPSAAGATAAEFENLFLDLAYGRASAELIRSRNALANLDSERLEIRANFFLDTEITTIRTALDHSFTGINSYLDLLEDPLGLPPINGNSAGRVLFQRQVPSRQLFPATDVNGVSVAFDNTVDPPVLLDPAVPLLDGYKDYVLILDLLLQHTRTVSDLVALLTARDTPADLTEARQLIGDTQRLVFEQRTLLNALFDPTDLTPIRRDDLGIAQLDRGLDTALSDLTAFSQNLDGTINLLGYEPDFLMLVKNQGGLFDSYDSFENILLDPNSPLEVAKTNRGAALTAIGSYGANQDALEAEFSLLITNSENSIGNRLTQIVGVPYADPPTPAYLNPQDNEGSEIWQQFQSIEAARLRILRNSTEISNLRASIRIEQQRRAAESGINSRLSDLIIDYGNQQASMTEEIGRIEAAQKAADALTELFEIDNLTKAITGVGVANAAIQAGGEIGKANLEASKERLAASQDAAIRDADDDILDNNSKAHIRNLWLEMNTLSIDTKEAVLLLRQEAGRLTGLLCEKADLERRLDEVDQELSARYFADPIHRLRAQHTTELATISFRNARRWLFFAARSLEYKWNTPINLPSASSPDGSAWKTTDLFKLRNADELNRFFIALDDWDTVVELNRTYITPDLDDWFSLREDYFGYKDFDDSDGTTQLFYNVVNPDTGLVENVNAVTAFRYALTRSLEDCNDDGNDDVCVRFDTIRQAGYDTTANSGAGGFQSNFFNPVNYLDRLKTIRVFVRGPHQFLETTDGDNTISTQLAYLGTSVLRNQSAGQPIDPLRPDRVSGEITSYPNRFYRFIPRDISDPLPSGYAFTEGLSANSAEALKILPGRSRSTLEPLLEPAAISDFSERSVATSSWTLVLFPSSGTSSGTRLVIDEIDDIELYIIHRAVQR